MRLLLENMRKKQQISVERGLSICVKDTIYDYVAASINIKDNHEYTCIQPALQQKLTKISRIVVSLSGNKIQAPVKSLITYFNQSQTTI